MALSLKDLGKAVVAAGLMPADELKALLASPAASARPKDAADLAKLLVERGALTRYQAEELLAGRGTGLVLGDYIVQDKIGAGGMGQVLKAEHRKMGRTVALKLMSASAMKDEAAIKRFHREVRAAARLEHLNIVTAHAAGEANGMHYLVMQCVEGSDLSGRVKKDGPLSIDLAMDCICQSARGLAYAHSEGIIHRDIKPANLLLDKKGVVKILDMGLARIDGGDAHDGLTGTEQVLGTVDYMSPEQAVSTRDCDARSDIYSLGCTLWYLLTGTKMYTGDSPIQRLMQHREAPLPSLLAARDNIPWALEKLFHKMVAKRPGDRCQTMDEVVREIEQIRGGPEPSRTNGLEGDTNLGQFLIAVGSKEPSRLSAKVKVAGGKSSTAEEPTVGHGDSLKVPMTAGVLNPPWKNPKVLAGTGSAAILLLLLGVWIIVRDKGGNEVARIEAPKGSTIEVKPKAPKPDTTNGAKEGSPFKAGSVIKSPETSKPKTPDVASPPDVPWPFDPKDSGEYTWKEPENLGPNINTTASEHNPAVSGDGLILMFVRNGELLEARRSSVDQPFRKPAVIRLEKNDQVRVGEPYLTPDGLTVYFRASVKSVPTAEQVADLYSMHRASRDGVWETAAKVVGLERGTRGPALAPDGLTFYFWDYRREVGPTNSLFMSRRKTLDAPWEKQTPLGPDFKTGASTASPHALADGRTLVFTCGGLNDSGDRISWAQSDTAGHWTLHSFNRPTANPTDGNPSLTADGRTMFIDSKRPGGQGENDLWVTRRVPKSIAPPPIPAGVLTFAGHRYLLVADLSNWNEAKAKAEAMGGHLVTITSKEERDWVQQNVSLKKPKNAAVTGMMDRIYLGGSRGSKATDAWAWVTGEPLDMAVWLGKGPDGSGAVLTWDGSHWDDVPASSKVMYFLVEWDTLGPAAGNFVYLDDLQEIEWKNGHMSLGKHGLNHESKPFAWRGKAPAHALLTHPSKESTASVAYSLEGKYESFTATVGKVINSALPLTFRVLGDGRELWKSPPIQKGTDEASVAISVRGVSQLRLEVECPADHSNAHAVWIDPRLTPIAQNVVYLDDLKEIAWQGLRQLGKHGFDADRKAISWNGKQPSHALFTHPTNDSSAIVSYVLDSKFDALHAAIGLAKKPLKPLTFRVWGDDKQLWESPPQTVDQKGTDLQLSVRNIKVLKLEVNCPGDCASAHAVWIEPRLTPVADSISSIANPQTIDVLALIDPARHSRNGVWKKENGLLVSPVGSFMTIELPVAPAASYRLELLAERLRGTEALSLGLIVGGQDVRLLLEGFNARLSGLDRIAGNSVQSPMNPTTYKEAVFHSGAPTRIEVEVASNRVQVLCDGKQIVAWSGPATLLTAPEIKSAHANAGTLWLSSYLSEYCISKLTYTPLDVPSLPAAGEGAKASPSAPANPQSAFDLLTSPDYEWTIPENLGPKFNSNKNEWAPALSADGLCLVFASNRDGRNADVYECRRKTVEESFSDPVAIPEFVSTSNDADPWISADGLTLLFATGDKRPGAQGEYDIYISRRANRDAPWSKPENQGSTINTDKTEAGPCLSPDGLTLYFHSNRVGSANNYTDIWVSRRKTLDAPWEPPVNLGGPVNSGSTDAQPKLAADGSTLLTVRDLGEGKSELRVSQLGSDGKWSKQLIELPADGEAPRNERFPFLAADGRTLYFTSARQGGLGGEDLWLTRRVPKKLGPALSAADPERRAAEWALSVGGRVSVLEPGKIPVSVSSAAALPKGPFLVRTVAISLADMLIRDDDMACLAALSDVWELEFDRVKGYSDAGLKHLSGLTKLKKLVFFDNSQVTDAGMKHLAGLKKLEELGLVATSVSDQGLREFNGCPLWRLNVGGRPSADKMMPVIEEFRNLLDLGLHGNVIRNDNAQGLQSLTKLQHLGLMGTSLTDEGLKAVGSLKVTHLHLQGPKFTDAGLKNLEGMTSLTKLSIRDTKATATGIAALQNALPNCEISLGGVKSASPAGEAAKAKNSLPNDSDTKK